MKKLSTSGLVETKLAPAPFRPVTFQVNCENLQQLEAFRDAVAFAWNGWKGKGNNPFPLTGATIMRLLYEDCNSILEELK